MKDYRWWTSKQQAEFVALYPTTLNSELAKRFERSPDAIKILGSKLGLKKTPEAISAVRAIAGRQTRKYSHA